MPHGPEPYTTILKHAVRRFYDGEVDLVPHLHRDPQGTLFALSDSPQRFGALKPLDPDARGTILRNLLTAARAFIVANRKGVEFADQLELQLPHA